jgi:hypothetical protein
VGIALGDDHDGFFLAERLDELDGAFSSNGEWQNCMGKKDCVADGEHRDDASGLSGALGIALAGVNHTEEVVGHESTSINFYSLDISGFEKVAGALDVCGGKELSRLRLSNECFK